MQEELNQFIANDVWKLVPQPRNMTIVGTKWVFRNKLDENGKVSRNKARPDIMFSVCLCARFQEVSKTSHLEMVKRIFRYIKGTTHLGIWYPKGTDIETVVYADSDHAGDYVDRKSTRGIYTFVGCCLTSWFSKKQTALAISTTEAEYKQTALAISTTEAEYVSAGKACQQALWMKQSLIDYDVRLDDIPIMCDNKAIDHYLSHDRVMHPLAPRYERKTRSDHGKKRPHESNASSSSTTLNHLSSSRSLDDTIDVNDDESFHSNSSFPSQNVSSSSNVVPRVRQNPPHKSHNLNTYLSETINLQTQQRDAHREGLMSIGQALKNMMITAVSTTITTAAPQLTTDASPTLTTAPSAARRRKGVDEAYARELEAELNKNIDWDEVIDHVQRKQKENNDVKRYQALKRKPQTKAQARKNMMIYLRNVAGFKMDYFKGMTYNDIRPIFQKNFNSNVAFLQKTKEQMDEEDSRALKRLSESQDNKMAKKHKLDEEVEELMKHFMIVPNDEDDVYTEATPLALKVHVVDYEIYIENNKPYYKIKRADGSHQLYLSFLSMLRNFNREDLEVLWGLVKERFASTKPKNFSDDFLLTTLGDV
nr:copia protein [Tanacetum cinerariifolium]